MRKASQYGTLELEIQIGQRTIIVTVDAVQGGWSTMQQEHVEKAWRLEGEPTIISVPASMADASAEPAQAAAIRAIYRPA